MREPARCDQATEDRQPIVVKPDYDSLWCSQPNRIASV